MAKSRLRRRRGVKNGVLRTLRMHYLLTFDIDEKVEMSKCRPWILNRKKNAEE